MNCAQAKKLLPLHAGGDLSEAEARETSRHLEGCADCRALEVELARSAAWLKLPAMPPVSESEYADLRRQVWKKIQAGGRESSLAPWGRRATLAGAGLLAVAVAALLLIGRPREPRLASVPLVAPAAPAVTAPQPAVTAQPPAVAEIASPAPSEPVAVAAVPRPRIRRHPRPAETDFAVDRIEFRTANPNVRIIWLVRKGEEKSSELNAGRNQEVS